MTPWTFAIAWRRFYQGVVVGHGLTSVAGWGTVLRFAAVLLGLGAAAAMGTFSGVTAGGAALSLSVILEAVVVTWLARPVIQAHYAREEGGRGDYHSADLSWGELVRFYMPLATTSLAGRLVPPILSGVIARAPDPAINLAAWPIATGLVQLFGVSTQMLSQLVIPVATHPTHRRTAMRFAHLVGLTLTALLLLMLSTPAGSLYFTGLIAAPMPVAAMAVVAARSLVMVPLLQSSQNALHGLYSGSRRTVEMLISTLINVAVTVAVSFLMVAVVAWPGTLVAAAGMIAGLAAEVAYLWIFRPAAARPGDDSRKEAP